MEFFKSHKTYDFMSQRKWWIALSIFLTIASIVSLYVPGPNYGTDFRGGTEIEVAFTKTTDGGQIREAVVHSGQFSEPDVVQVQSPTSDSQFLIRVQEISTVDDTTKEALKKALCFGVEGDGDAACPKNAQATEVKFSAGGDKLGVRYDTEPDLEKIKQQVQTVANVKLRVSDKNPQVVNKRDHRVEIQLQSKGDQLMDVLRAQLGDAVPDHALRVEWVGPKAGKQLRDSARNAVALSIVFIMIYLAFRFDLRFAPGVVLACVHDAVVVLGAFVVTRREVTLSTIAVVLTIVGYSMNDTVVVYDRIRENLGKHRGKSFGEIINMSVSETLSRTILTSGATMLSVLAFFIWGTGVLKDFAFGMVVGIVAGTYSSIYVAAPLTEWIDKRISKRSQTASMKKRLRAKPA
ncbi:MAG: protein translocase subunit SecF [Labilithrix sp.]|nr:protein translocase subunit SecF [Labilithrix sp.]MCW5812935.1 protein translocase subunit SecF [Labilithrix sp.]